jgi:hypothetical protein
VTTRCKFACAFALTALFAVLGAATGQGPSPAKPGDEPAVPVDAATRARVAEKLATELESTYVFPDVAKKMGESIREKLAHKGYDACETASALAKQLTTDMQAVSHDKHLRVMYGMKAPPGPAGGKPPPEMEKRRAQMTQKQNAGFVKLERLTGNIGLVELRGFASAKAGAETVAAAMNFLAGTDALIFDVRKNGGGEGEMVQLICSYLLPADKPIHLNSFYWRKGDRTEEFWTLKDLPGKRYLEKDVYVLTSRATFSAAEEFTYNLKNLKRATIVGETTGGGAHPGGVVPLGDKFGAFIASGRAINPITKTNWEGTGVKPDVEVDADQALDVARELALKKIRERLADQDAKEFLDREVRGAERMEKFYKERKNR